LARGWIGRGELETSRGREIGDWREREKKICGKRKNDAERVSKIAL
jgi:hypothetical protein